MSPSLAMPKPFSSNKPRLREALGTPQAQASLGISSSSAAGLPGRAELPGPGPQQGPGVCDPGLEPSGSVQTPTDACDQTRPHR